jgi:hypothetical protein
MTSARMAECSWETTHHRQQVFQSSYLCIFFFFFFFNIITFIIHLSFTHTTASDPSFWVIHGTVERMLQLMRIESRFTSEEWTNEVFDSNIHPYTTTCSGHYETDKLAFGSVDGHDFTNGS